MASAAAAGSDGDQPSPRLLSIPKEGERILAATRRPDGTLRKEIRIRAGYTPQDEVAIYQPKGALLKKESRPEVPPGYDPALAEKPKTKAAKRNERKKEKRQQAAHEKENNIESQQDAKVEANNVPSAEHVSQSSEQVELVTEQISRISVSAMPISVGPSSDTIESTKSESSSTDLDKKIRALKKKIRLAEAQLQGDQQNMKPEQIEKLKKVEAWHEELKLLEAKKS